MSKTNPQIVLFDKDSGARSNFKQAIRAAYPKARTAIADSSEHAVELLTENSTGETMLFVSSNLGPDSLMKIHQALDSTEKTVPPTLVMLNAEHQDSTAISGFVAAGATSFLCLPYSPDSLRSLITELIDEGTLPNGFTGEQREAATSEFATLEARHQLDVLAEAQAQHKPAGYAARALKRLSPLLSELQSQDSESYVTRLLKQFSKAAPRIYEPLVKDAPIKKEKQPVGVVLAAKLNSRNISPVKFLSIAKISKADFDAVIHGRASMLPSFAQEVCRILGGTPDEWERKSS